MSRIVADFVSPFPVLQVEKTPDEGELRPFNGRWALPIPPGSSVTVDASSYFLPQDSGSLPYLSAEALLARYPMYSHIAWNYLLESTDVADLDLTATGPSGEVTRCQTGRGTGPGVFGQSPNTTAILPQNAYAVPSPKPGCLVTDTIDITVPTSGAGADEFMAWWHLYEFNTTQDVMSDFGGTLGENTPATRNIIETDQEPADLAVFISHDDGVTWTPISRLEPTDLVTFNTLVRLAFVNTGTTKLYLAGYAVMF